MSLTIFPVETENPKINVVLPRGTHLLKLTVIDDAGTESPADTVAINIVAPPTPSIDTIMPDRVFKGATVDAVIRGTALDDITSIKVFRDADEDDRVTISIREGSTHNVVPVSITVMDHAHAGNRTLVISTAGGTATVALKVLSTEGVKIRAVAPTSAAVGSRQPVALRVEGDHLEDVTAVVLHHPRGLDDPIPAVIRARQPDYVSTDLSLSVNRAFGSRIIAADTTTTQTQSPPGVRFTVLPGILQYAVMATTLITAAIHLYLGLSAPILLLNALGYVAILVALYAPIAAPLTRRRPLIRWVLVGYTLLTVALWIAMGTRSTLAYVTKLDEVLLVLLLLWESRRP